MRYHRQAGAIDRRYRPLHLVSRRPTRALAGQSEAFRRWGLAIALAAPVLALAAACVCGWPGPINWEPIATVTLGAFFWSAALFRFASHIPSLEQAGPLRAANSLVLVTLSTFLIAVTGGALSPLFWIYVVLILGEARQSRWRAAATAWLSWAMFCGLVVVQVSGKLPEVFTGIVWKIYPLASGWLAHALGIEIWYFAIAAGVTGVARWMDEQEGDLQRRQDVLDVRERAMTAEHEALQTGRQQLGRRIFEFDQTQRRFEAERIRWEDEHRHAAAMP